MIRFDRIMVERGHFAQIRQGASASRPGSGAASRIHEIVLPHNHNDSDAKNKNKMARKGGVAMSDSNCAIMEMYCLEQARSEPQKRGKWLAQAERWHELGRARSAWRSQNGPLQQSMQVWPMAKQSRQQS